MFNSNKGITLLTLTITIVIMLILSFTISFNVSTYVERRQKTNLETDIIKLQEEIANYYSKNKTLPIANKYTNTQMLEKSINDNENYYVIDLSKISNLDLNYGKDYDKIIDYSIEISDLLDIYIINERAHTIYYPKGIKYSGKMYYTTVDTNNILIEDIPLSGIEIKGDATGKVGDIIQLTANMVPNFVENTGVIWSSNNETLATVDENGKVTLKAVGTVTITATSKDNEKIKATSDIKISLLLTEITAENYGDKVDYSAGGIDDWKIFYKDESNVFLITGDVVNNYDNINMAQMIENSGMTRYSDTYKYSQRWETIPTEKTIDADKAKKFKLSYTDITNNNMKCISRLMDSKTWSPLVDITKADSAIGTPTLEMWIDSWNSKYGTQIYYSSKNSIGYSVGEVANPDGTVDVELETKEGYNDELYFPHNNVLYYDNNLGYFFASPSVSSTDRIARIWWYKGTIGTALYNDSSTYSLGIRPVVRLQSTVTAIKDDTTGIWILQ